MAATTLPSRTSNIVVPSIHLGSFSPYPTMPHDVKQSIRFPEENSTIPIFREEKAASYPQPQSQPRNPPQWRGPTASYPPNQSYTYNSYSANRASYTPGSGPPRTPPPAGALYPSVAPSPPVQPPNSPAQLPGPPREVCVECMMRDEDMADVDVTSPGVWERESDVLYQDLCQREEEEERDRECKPGTSSTACSSASEPRPRSRGTAKLTEGNLKVWLTLNPREPASKHQNLHLYLDAQNALLLAESKARLQAVQESRQLDNKMRDAYSELRRSAYDLGANASALDDGGVKIRSPSGGNPADDMKHKRDTTLLENGMIIERVDMRKEEARLRKEERRARKASRDSLSAVDNRDRERDTMSMYSLQAAEGTPSLRTPGPYESTMSVPMPTSRSVRSMYTTPSSSWQPGPPNRPMSMSPSGSGPGFTSQTSLDSMGSPRRRFFGIRHWSGYFSSNTSLATGGSMVDMHLGLDQEKHLAQIPHVDIGSNAPSLREAWPRMDDGSSPRPTSDRASSTTRSKKKKRRGLGRLWKIITGGPSKTHDVHPRSDHGLVHEDEDEDLPLAPPPPLSYLVNRGSAQSERSMMGTGRHVSMPSLTSINGPHHPRSSSAPSNVGLSVSSPSEKSSMLPSPTEVRFPYRDSSGDEPEDDDGLGDIVGKKLRGSSPPRPLVTKISEPDFRRLSPVPLPASPTPITRNGPSSSSLVPTIRVPPPRPVSVMSLDKNLPPLPPGEYEPAPQPQDRPRTSPMPVATLPMATYSHHGLTVPNAGFRSEDAARRQSFNGLSSRPALPRGAGLGPGVQMDDFGVSRHSLMVFEPATPSAKRRSRFGISGLLGKKEKGGKEQHRREMSGSREISYDTYAGHVAPSVSMSMSERSSQHAPRRPLDELVPQESDFVAYRYPSRDERLDLSRG